MNAVRLIGRCRVVVEYFTMSRVLLYMIFMPAAKEFHSQSFPPSRSAEEYTKRSTMIFMAVPRGRVCLPIHAEGKKERGITALGKRKAIHVVRIGRSRHFNGHWRFVDGAECDSEGWKPCGRLECL